MTHLPFIVASYALGTLIPAAFGIGAWTRASAARRRLLAIDPRFQARESRTQSAPQQDRPQFQARGDAR